MDNTARETVQESDKDQAFVVLRKIDGQISQTIIVDLDDEESDCDEFIVNHEDNENPN